MIYAGTGHRPPKLGLGYTPEDNRILTEFVVKQLQESVGIGKIISGMATGFDQALAHAAILCNIPFIAAVPFEGMEAKWPEDGKKRFDALLQKAEEVVIVSEGGYSNKKFYVRDTWMVDHANGVLALYDESCSGSGTGITVKYAQEKGVRVWNLWNKWMQPSQT